MTVSMGYLLEWQPERALGVRGRRGLPLSPQVQRFSDGDSASSDFSTTGRSDTPTAALGGGGVPSGVEDCSSESLKVTPANLSVKLRLDRPDGIDLDGFVADLEGGLAGLQPPPTTRCSAKSQLGPLIGPARLRAPASRPRSA